MRSQSETLKFSSHSEDSLPRAKLLVLGASGIGKSQLISAFSGLLDRSGGDPDLVRSRDQPTIGCDYTSRIFPLSETRKIRLNIWDTAGQEKYKSISRNCYSGSNGVLLCFDLSAPLKNESIQEWMDEIDSYVSTDCVKVLIGTKTDKIINQDTLQCLTEFAENNELSFIGTSAATGVNVYSAFETVAKKMEQFLVSMNSIDSIKRVQTFGLVDGLMKERNFEQREICTKRCC